MRKRTSVNGLYKELNRGNQAFNLKRIWPQQRLPWRYRVRVDIARLLARERSPMGTVESTCGPAFYCRRHAGLVEYISYKRANSGELIPSTKLISS
jgi:hypothetical protein